MWLVATALVLSLIAGGFVGGFALYRRVPERKAKIAAALAAVVILIGWWALYTEAKHPAYSEIIDMIPHTFVMAGYLATFVATTAMLLLILLWTRRRR